MNTRTSPKALLIIIGILLLSNIALLFTSMKSKPANTEIKKEERVKMADRLKNEVGFSEEQLAKYLEMREKQKATIRPMFDAMRQTKDSFFQKISDPAFTEANIEEYSNRIGIQQQTLDKQTFVYFRQVRDLCTPEQLIKYDSLVHEVFKKMSAPHGRPKDKEKDKNKKD